MAPIADDVRSASAQPLAGAARWLLRRVCTSNPFYVLSAGLFLAGLWISFGGQTQAEETWMLMSGLAGYTLLLAVTAYLLVHFCNVWEDVRTVLLLVVLMFLAMSVTFDELLVLARTRGIIFYLGGLLFAMAVSEGLLRGIRLRLPVLFRVPYYLLLMLFFLYPLALSPLVDGPRSEGVLWGLFAFAPAAGLVFLSLLPAIRRGPDYVRANGSPWSWPLYPWVLFGVFGLAVVGRSWLLCVSMDLLNMGHGGRVIFGPYFLVPFGFALAILLMEIGIVSGSRAMLGVALLTPTLLLALTLVGRREDAIFQDFARLFAARLGGDPLYLTFWATAAYYTYAALRRVALASAGLTAILASLAVIGPDFLETRTLLEPRAEPLLAVAVLQLGLGIWRRSSWHCFLASAALVAIARVLLVERGLLATLFVYHLLVLAILTVGAVFDDTLARALRVMGALLALWPCWAALDRLPEGFLDLPSWMVLAYPLTMAGLLTGYGMLLRSRPALTVGGLVLCGWLAAMGLRGYATLRQLVTGLDYLAVSLTLFVVAVLVSLGKSGLLPRRRGWRWRRAPQSTE